MTSLTIVRIIVHTLFFSHESKITNSITITANNQVITQILFLEEDCLDRATAFREVTHLWQYSEQHINY